MKKLNEVEIYLLEHWEDVMKLEEAVNSFRGKLKDAIQEVAEELEKGIGGQKSLKSYRLHKHMLKFIKLLGQKEIIVLLP